MTESDTPHLRAKLPVDSLDGFFEAFGQFILPGRMFLPTDPDRLKSVGDSVQFEVLLSDGSRALAGKGIVRQVRSTGDASRGPAGMVVEYTHLSKRSKAVVKDILQRKKAAKKSTSEATSLQETTERADTDPSLEETTERADPREEVAKQAAAAPAEAPEETSEVDGDEADDETLDEMAQTGFDVGDDSDVAVSESDGSEDAEDAGGEFEELGVSAGAEAALFGEDHSAQDAPADQEESDPGDSAGESAKSGLQVLPYEDDDEAPEDGLGGLDFGEDSDVDRMLDNMFGGGSEDSDMSEEEATDALFADAFGDDSGPTEQADEDSSPDQEDETTADELSALADGLAAQPPEPADASPEGDAGSVEQDLPSETDEPIQEPDAPGEDSGELDEAFRALDEDDEEPQRRSDFKLAIEEDEEDPEPPADDDSLDALIADTKQDLEPVSAESDDEDEGDALDRVLGGDLPDPPSDDFDFGSDQDFRPAGARKEAQNSKSQDGEDSEDDPAESGEGEPEQKEKRKGFLSRFFGGDD